MKGKVKNPPLLNGVFKILLVFLVFLFLFSIAEKNKVVQKWTPAKNYPGNSQSLGGSAVYTTPAPPPFSWTVEKVDEHLTKLALPPDPRMSTAEELFTAMNSYRGAHGLSQLQKSETLCSIAQNRANEQLQLGDLDNHAGFSKYAQNQNDFSRMGEVLFGGSQPQYGVHIVEYGWDRSLTGHKEAISDPSWTHGCGGIAGYFAVFIFGSN